MRWLFKLLSVFCPDHLYEEIEGDLIQKYERNIETFGIRRSKVKLAVSIVRFFRPGILLRNKFTVISPFYMLSHFIKIFFRTSMRNLSYTFINVGGLAVGLACSIFTLLWTLDELSYDKFHTDRASIYSILTNSSYNDGMFTFGGTSGRMAEGLRELPEVESTCRTNDVAKLLIGYNNKAFYEAGTYADASMFSIFTFPVIEGSVDDPLPDNNAIVITEKMAQKYFNGESAVGRILRIDNRIDARVTAVIKNVPAQSSLQFQFVLPYSIYAKSDQYNKEWGAWTGGSTYVKLHDGANATVVNEKISRLITHPRIWPRWGNNVEPFLFPMKDWRLRDQFENGKQSGGRIAYVMAFGLIALFILLIACVNFMNMATARSMNRAKEIGVRKVVGAGKQSIRSQFLGESVLISLLSLFVALIVVHLLLPYFNLMTGKSITVDYSNTMLVLSMIGIALLTGLIAGSYPAIFLSSLRVMSILKDKLTGHRGVGVRKILVVFQFSLSAVFIICALVVYNQIEHMRNKNLGFDKENGLYIDANSGISKNYNVLKQQLIGQAGIRSVSRGAGEPMDIQNALEMGDDGWPGKTKEDNVNFQWLFCDEDFLPAFKFEILEGRNFSAELPADTSNFIITEEAARRMKLTHPVGQIINADVKGTIIAVIKDFHGKGPGQPMFPVVIGMRPKQSNLIFIHYEPGRMQDAMSHLESIYRKIEPDFPMEYTFLDDSFDRQYKTEILFRRMSTAFMIVAVFISCLGLIGLASFMAERRIKEIGIRKVLGAEPFQLVVLLCRDFVMLVTVALCIGFPLAWWVCTQFLKSYPSRITLGLTEFAITGLSLLLIAILSVSYQSAKAAMSNPVKTLKAE